MASAFSVVDASRGSADCGHPTVSDKENQIKTGSVPLVFRTETRKLNYEAVSSPLCPTDPGTLAFDLDATLT
jgi:hypothetical protein